MVDVRKSSSRFAACFLAVLIPSLGYCNPVVNTSTGFVQGLHLSYNDGESVNDYYVYKGIPYAQPPVGPLRFRAPVSKTPWDGVFNATSYGPSCPQDIAGVSTFYPDYVVQIPDEAYVMSEDCLTLNVYSPFNVSDGSTAVILWIHGGSFETGQGSGYDASALAVRGHVVVVTINYRLNVFGFLCTNDDNSPGNYGLLDQQLALMWVHDNIAGFGGDASRVTLVGQSAGGASVFTHLFAENSRPLFQRIAAHSGFWLPIHSHGRAKRLSEKAHDIGMAANCGSTSVTTEDLVTCLRELSMNELLATALAVARETRFQIFGPVFDGNMLFPTMDHLNAELQHDVMLLITSGEGSSALEVSNMVLSSEIDPNIGLTEMQWQTLVDFFFAKIAGTAVSYEYVDKSTEDGNIARLKAWVDMFQDKYFVSRIKGALDAVPNATSIRMSVFDHRSDADKRWPRLGGLVPHSEEISYLFGLPFNGSGLGSLFTAEERVLSDRVIKYWSNFAKSGDPNVDPELTTAPDDGLTYWPGYGDSESYLLLGLNSSTVGEGYGGDKVAFWNDYLPSLSYEAFFSCIQDDLESSYDDTGDYDQPSGEDNDSGGEDNDGGDEAGNRPPCKDIFFGESLGFKLTKNQIEKLIEVLMFVIIALLIVLVLVMGLVIGYKFKAKETTGKVATANLTKTDESAKRSSVTKLNARFESGDSKM